MVVFDVVFYSQNVLRPCVIDGYALEKLRKLSLGVAAKYSDGISGGTYVGNF